MNDDLLFKTESYKIVGACFEVYREKGCGFLEPVYQECMEIELRLQGIPYVAQKEGLRRATVKYAKHANGMSKRSVRVFRMVRGSFAFGRHDERIEVPLPIGGLLHRLDLRPEMNPLLRLGQ